MATATPRPCASGARFHDVSGDIDALGYDARFRRLWDDYLAYCESRS